MLPVLYAIHKIMNCCITKVTTYGLPIAVMWVFETVLNTVYCRILCIVEFCVLLNSVCGIVQFCVLLNSVIC